MGDVEVVEAALAGQVANLEVAGAAQTVCLIGGGVP